MACKYVSDGVENVKVGVHDFYSIKVNLIDRTYRTSNTLMKGCLRRCKTNKLFKEQYIKIFKFENIRI